MIPADTAAENQELEATAAGNQEATAVENQEATTAKNQEAFAVGNQGTSAESRDTSAQS